MARLLNSATGSDILPAGTGTFFKHRLLEVLGLALCAAAAALLALLVTFQPTDPSLNTATEGSVYNLLGTFGARGADLLLQILGAASGVPVIVLAVWGWHLISFKDIGKLNLRILALLVATVLMAASLAVLPRFVAWPLESSLGGIAGSLILDQLQYLTQTIGLSAPRTGLLFAIVPLALLALFVALGLSFSEWRSLAGGLARLTGNLGHSGLSVAIWLRQLGSRRRADDALIDPGPSAVPPRARREPSLKKKAAVVPNPKAVTKPSTRAARERQRSLDFGPSAEYTKPPLNILDELPPQQIHKELSAAALEQNARMLESVLRDFGVMGEIVKVHPGPVVTLYELEPAPGTKTSRVISLADDIARSMSAVSVRVAVVPGRNVIGLELPNSVRKMVSLRELVASQDYERNSGALTLALGKDIGGAPVMVDLARMPHLLIAGTTGSGKSVAMNTMILSLLYQLPPEECRFIMIDPKMLELSVYDGIPHLLCPVVTEPSKAIVALKWTVREMEERYRAISQLGVRNIAGYNARLTEAQRKGETLTRRVQTGFDPESGKPIFEDQALSMEPLPLIVVVVDEMADLMLVAGKDIEAAVQRLAQMARAAGIHMIMATQRPSVDVITGTIKANFPTRISFQVTSKIDSRTILGEQGAEQLLGQGDMLYMAGGGRITRVHGPFVSDEEVEQVVSFVKAQGSPDYLDAITEEDEAAMDMGVVNEKSSSDDEFYDQAVALVGREGKASTSFIQRHFQIGYNRAARIIEQMEREGVISEANRTGRREVLISQA
jgi:S-DNA-T family DNA segregation ATPase FtsK/SpoIIIE